MNVPSAALSNLGDLRKFNKKKMEAAEHGSDDYIYYRILQLTYKVLMNSFYRNLRRKEFCLLQSVCPEFHHNDRRRFNYNIYHLYGRIPVK